jgi:AAA family ATP:ADP antiporter
VRALERSLMSRSVAIEGRPFLDRTTAVTVLSVQQTAELPRLVERLADETQAEGALRALRTDADRFAKGMLQALADPTQPPAVRRRLPRALSAARGPEVVGGLLGGLFDERFEVRLACGRALARIAERSERPSMDAAQIYDAVLREVSVSRAVWHGRRLAEDADAPFGGTLLEERADKSLEHVFTLLALVLPREPLFAAHHALHSRDAYLRGTALEYLESVLPHAVRERLFPFLESESQPPASLRTPAQLEAELVKLSQTLRLEIARRR